jgi:hypothetical protein
MERRGFIVTLDGHDRHWTGRRVRNYFVREGEKLEHWYSIFEYRGIEYRLRYFDGCFKPFVTRVDCALSLPSFV